MPSLKKLLVLASLMLIIVAVNSASLSRQRRFIKGAFLKSKKSSVAAPGPFVVTFPVPKPIIPGTLKKVKILAKLKKAKKLGLLTRLDPSALTAADLPLLTSAGLTSSDLAFIDAGGITSDDFDALGVHDDYDNDKYYDDDDDDDDYRAPYGYGAGPYGYGAGPYGYGTGPYGNDAGPYGNGAGPYGNGAGPYGNGAGPFGNGAGPYADDDDHDDDDDDYLPYGNGLQPEVRVFYINQPVPAPYPSASYGNGGLPATAPYAPPNPFAYGH